MSCQDGCCQGPKTNMNVYREVFFAGFPGRKNARTHPQTKQPLVFPPELTRRFFEQFGPLASYYYNEDYGYGAITYARGPDAERCYLTAHMALLPPPEGTGEPAKANGGTTVSAQSGSRFSMVTVEFAQALPFVNPMWLLHHRDALPTGEFSRHSLRHLALVAPNVNSVTAGHPVLRWERDDGGKLSGRNGPYFPPFEVPPPPPKLPDGEQETPEQAEQRRARAEALRHPFVAVPAALADTMARLLAPAAGAHEGKTATVREMWWQYYLTYVVHKTRPEAPRVLDKTFLAATLPSTHGEVQALIDGCKAGGGAGGLSPDDCVQRLGRLDEDHIYHSVLTYIQLRRPLFIDPTWASFMRDVYQQAQPPPRPAIPALVDAFFAGDDNNAAEEKTEEGKPAAAEEADSSARRAETMDVLPEVQQRRLLAAQHILAGNRLAALGDAGKDEKKFAAAEEQRQLEEEEALTQWLALPLLDAGSNLLENVKFLDKVREGLVGRDGRLMLDPTQRAAGGDYPAPSRQQQTMQMYQQVVQTVDSYLDIATSAAALMALCESNKAFRFEPNHIGYDEVQYMYNKQTGHWKSFAGAIGVAALFVTLTVLFVNYVVVPFGTGHGYAHRPAPQQQQQQQKQQQQQQKGTGPSVADQINEQVRKAKEEAAKRGAKFNIEMRADL